MLTFILPSIRPNTLPKTYHSIAEAYHGEYEVIIISPYDLPEELKDKPYINYIFDKGNPNRCKQRALCQARGDFITWAVDDGYLLPKTIDNAIKLVTDDMTVVTLKYLEGDNPQGMLSDLYYEFAHHEAISGLKGVPKGCYVLSFGLMKTSLLKAVGGWSMDFESAAMADSDLSIRLKKYGAKFIVSQEPCLKCTWFEGTTVDHAPLHFSQIEHDEPLFRQIWSQENDRICVNLNAWESVPSVWERRFE